jgi:hypothetical protein
MLAFRLLFFFILLFNSPLDGMGWLLTSSSHPSGNKPACSLPCPVGWKQVYSWWAADSDKQSVLHVIHLLLHQSIISRALFNCLLNIVSAFAGTLGAPALCQLVSPAWEHYSVSCLLWQPIAGATPYSIKQIVDRCLISCSAPGILCSSGSLPSSLLHGARYLWQWVNGQWCPWPSTRWRTQCQRGGQRCGQAPTRSQGKREACHVLLLRCWAAFTKISWSIPCIGTVSMILSDTEFMH